jgi:hypothetical protein
MQVLRPIMHKNAMITFMNTKHPKHYSVLWYERETSHSVVLKSFKTEKGATNWDKKHPPEPIKDVGDFDSSLIIKPRES